MFSIRFWSTILLPPVSSLVLLTSKVIHVSSSVPTSFHVSFHAHIQVDTYVLHISSYTNGLLLLAYKKDSILSHLASSSHFHFQYTRVIFCPRWNDSFVLFLFLSNECMIFHCYLNLHFSDLFVILSFLCMSAAIWILLFCDSPIHSFGSFGYWACPCQCQDDSLY